MGGDIQKKKKRERANSINPPRKKTDNVVFIGEISASFAYAVKFAKNIFLKLLHT